MGVPLGRRLGNLRGFAAALSTLSTDPSVKARAKHLAQKLSSLDWRQLMPMDEVALEHAKEHLEDDSAIEFETKSGHVQSQAALASYVEELLSLCLELNIPIPGHFR
jgi:hypothetical protein